MVAAAVGEACPVVGLFRARGGNERTVMLDRSVGNVALQTRPVLRQTGVKNFLNDAQLRDLERFCRAATRRPGTTLFRQEEPAETLYLVLEGSVELRARPPGRRVYRTVEVVGEGCTLGDEALFGEARYLTSARVLE